MRIRETSSRRYAEGFLRYSQETLGVDNAVRELQDLREIMAKDPQLLRFFNNRAIHGKNKLLMIDGVFAPFLSRETRAFLKLLVAKSHFADIADIIDIARDIASQKDSVKVVVSAAFTPDKEEIALLRERIEKRFQKKALITVETAKDMIGGMEVRVGNLLFSGSVRRYLDDLREKLLNAKVSQNAASA